MKSNSHHCGCHRHKVGGRGSAQETEHKTKCEFCLNTNTWSKISAFEYETAIFISVFPDGQLRCSQC